jgi:hypothetical protein
MVAIHDELEFFQMVPVTMFGVGFLHYKYIDKADLKARHSLLRHGLQENDLKRGLGKQYQWSDADFELAWDRISRDSMDYTDPSVGFATHIERWWRGKRAPYQAGG